MDEVYDFLLDRQERYGERWHKGWELHNGGIARLRIGEPEEGIDRILLAYAEDALSEPKGEEDRIDDGPAGKTLESAGLRPDLLTQVKEVARECKPDNVPRDPSEVLERAKSYMVAKRVILGPIAQFRKPWVKEEKRKAAKPPTDEMPLPPEKRCFVGGSYYYVANIPEIVRIVSNEGFLPIVADDFQVGPLGVHHHSLQVLHLCPRAVFEVTHDAGHLMELERCRDYDIKPLLVRNTRAGQPLEVSEMISSMAGMKLYPYTLIKELELIIADYLHERGDWARSAT